MPVMTTSSSCCQRGHQSPSWHRADVSLLWQRCSTILTSLCHPLQNPTPTTSPPGILTHWQGDRWTSGGIGREAEGCGMCSRNSVPKMTWTWSYCRRHRADDNYVVVPMWCRRRTDWLTSSFWWWRGRFILIIWQHYVTITNAHRHVHTHTHTHTHTRLMALCPGLLDWAGTRKEKPIWILLKQETVSGSGIRWAICKSAPHSSQITTPVRHHSVF